MKKPSVAVVGAGILGLAHAWSAAERGFDVTVFERSQRAAGASVRNFGMIWPIGQPPGDSYETALLSRSRWLRLAEQAGLWVNPCGSIHLAHRSDEMTVLEQFADKAEDHGISCSLLTPREVLSRTPAANPDGLLGGLLSDTELCVNPREATRSIPGWLARNLGVRFQFGTHVSRLDPAGDASATIRLQTSQPDARLFDRVVVCCGSELQTLFPEIREQSGLRRCKLQMLSVRRFETEWNLGPHLAGGLTLRHYRNFEICPGLPALKRRIADETPELDQFGIHVMASQNNYGQVILGDSHEYDESIEPFDKSLIDELILRELHRIIRLPEWTIGEHWHGIYAKHPTLPVIEAEPIPGVTVCTGTGGAGMTMSFGLTEKMWDRWTMSCNAVSGTSTGR